MLVVGVATGLEIFVALSPFAGDQAYVTPPLAERLVEFPKHIAVFSPASAVGKELTVTITASVAEHPPAETVTV
jgi:hypothetical protein